MKYDFSGWATRNDILCTDGRTIRKDAFKECDGKTVPLVWNHQHNDPENVLGHALLKNMDDGVFAYCSFNGTQKAQSAKLAVEHGDYDSLSIYANKLKQQGGNVLHGEIKEVSLVLAGANAGAHIVDVIRHGEVSEDEFVIFSGEEISLEHAADVEDAKPEPKEASKEEKKNDEEETVGDIFNTLTEKQKTVVYALIAQALNDKKGEKEGAKTDEAKHADSDEDEKTDDGKKSDDEETVGDVFNTLTEKQKKVVYALIGQALSDEDDGDAANKNVKHADKEEDGDEDDDDGDGETVGDVFNTLTEKQKTVVYALIGQALKSRESAKHSDNDSNNIEHTEGGNEMNRNIFEGTTNDTEILTHAEQEEIINEAKRNGSLKDAVLAHGITSIGEAYPDSKATSDRPQYISQDQKWVSKVLNGVHHTPFARIKSLYADITAESARAKGYYTKGSQKAEETIALLKRATEPTTVYKLQKLDRDDVIDITDFDVVAWLKEEMRIKLNEELARAYLIGDGRTAGASDKINEEKIRPIWKMEDLFAINATFEVAANATESDIAKAMIKAAVKGFDDYDGSGNTTLFIASNALSNLLLLEDGFGHRLYKSKEELATAMLVDDIVAVPDMKNKTRTVTISNVDHTRYLAGIIVDLRDYNVGMDKGGQINWFDDFDINFNKQEYLIETRQSGTLVKPKSAIVLEYEVAAAQNNG